VDLKRSLRICYKLYCKHFTRKYTRQKARLSLGRGDRTAFIRRPASDLQLQKESDFTEWPYTLWWCCYVEHYNQRQDTDERWSLQL